MGVSSNEKKSNLQACPYSYNWGRCNSLSPARKGFIKHHVIIRSMGHKITEAKENAIHFTTLVVRYHEFSVSGK